ncbi:helix-hairpin-helix domain-containing protein [Mucilaginibacter sp. UYCu711]|uniref:helix-hairpin-helix domain-containing protein n=1 Tax=Mucilaginibacter sp. UYCu711 TaxID=3156339 RepID=UPI003D25986C
MKKKIDLELTSPEKQILKKSNITQKSFADLAVDEIIAVLNPEPQRARIIQALYEFQSIPSIGIRFAHDLIFLGYYQLAHVKDKNGPDMLNEYEHKIGYKVDPCVEDQFWLVVYHANHPQSKNQWWDFTAARKAYRNKYGYPNTRPK